jgi:hypothetical protein
MNLTMSNAINCAIHLNCVLPNLDILFPRFPWHLMSAVFFSMRIASIKSITELIINLNDLTIQSSDAVFIEVFSHRFFLFATFGGVLPTNISQYQVMT